MFIVNNAEKEHLNMAKKRKTELEDHERRQEKYDRMTNGLPPQSSADVIVRCNKLSRKIDPSGKIGKRAALAFFKKNKETYTEEF